MSSETDQQRRLAAVVAADVAGYSRLMGADEAGTRTRFRAIYDDVFVPRTERRGGRIVKTMGDGLLIEFSSVVDAVQCAIGIQEMVAAQQADTPEDRRMRFRIGVNLGDVIIEGDDIHGDGVNVAARLEALADPGGLCVSAAVFDQVRGKVDLAWEDIGPQTLKNIAAPVHAYSLSAAALGEGQRPPDMVSGHPSVAVLPFRALSLDPEQEFAADILTDDVITLLARMPGFFVISRSSVFAFKGRSPDVRQVGRELGVRYVVEGSVRGAGPAMRVNIQLIEAETGTSLWADRIEPSADDTEELHDRIAGGVVARLEPELARAELSRIERQRPANPDVWSLYRQAHGVFTLRGLTRETFEDAAALLERAIALDPGFALGHAYLALVLGLQHISDLADDSVALAERIRATGARAIELDGYDSDVLGYAGCALSYLGEAGEGIPLLERAIEHNPSNAQAWVALGTAHLSANRPDAAVEALEHGIRISPRDNRLSVWESVLALAYLSIGRVDDAIEHSRAACRRDGKTYMSRLVLASALVEAKDLAGAKAAMDDALRIRPDMGAHGVPRMIGLPATRALMKAGLLKPGGKD